MEGSGWFRQGGRKGMEENGVEELGWETEDGRERGVGEGHE